MFIGIKACQLARLTFLYKFNKDITIKTII